MIPVDELPKDPMELTALDDTVQNPFRSGEYNVATRVCCSPCLAVWYLWAAYPISKLLLFFLYLPYVIVVSIWNLITSAANNLAELTCPAPVVTVDAETAKKLGLTLDEQGHVVDREIPMRPLTLVLRYVRQTIQDFSLFVFVYLVWLAIRELGATEAYLHNAWVHETTKVTYPGPANFIGGGGTSGTFVAA